MIYVIWGAVVPLLLRDADVERLRATIVRETGLVVTSSNRALLEKGVRERIRSSRAPSAREYCETILSRPEELMSLLEWVTIKTTRFFRNAAHFAAIELDVIPEIVRRVGGRARKTIRLWSAGCSTGEEPYSLAILLDELLPSGYSFHIFASDLSSAALAVARRGFYGPNRMNGVSDARRDRYFIRRGDGYIVRDEIKDRVGFGRHNLKLDEAPTGFDLVMCRNVITYLDEQTRSTVAGRLWNAMNDRSFLFVGDSESLLGMDTRFEFRKTDHATFYVKQAK